MKVQFGDLSREYTEISNEIDDSIAKVIKSGWFVLGEEVKNFENNFASYIGTKYSVGCANGTDAITLALLAIGIKKDDEVITQTNTCIPTICGIVNSKATPVLCDVQEDTLMIYPNDVVNKITAKTKAILPVNLYGSSADYEILISISKKYSIPIIEDCAQSHGSKFCNQKTGTFGSMGCFSFYPSKNLGCYGDGGAITTNSEEFYNKLLMLRNYGQEKRYFHTTFGLNSRLDEIQASILNTKLRYLDKWNIKRREIANRYNEGFEKYEHVIPLSLNKQIESVYHLYVVKVKNREKLQDFLISKNITTLIHYPIPCHLQKAYQYLSYKEGDFEVSEKNSKEILSLPIFPQLKNSEVDYVIESVKDFYENHNRK